MSLELQDLYKVESDQVKLTLLAYDEQGSQLLRDGDGKPQTVKVELIRPNAEKGKQFEDFMSGGRTVVTPGKRAKPITLPTRREYAHKAIRLVCPGLQRATEEQIALAVIRTGGYHGEGAQLVKAALEMFGQEVKDLDELAEAQDQVAGKKKEEGLSPEDLPS